MFCTGVDAGEVSSPAPQQQKPTRKAQQAVTKFVRYDGTQRPAKKQAQLQRDQQALDTDAAALPAAEPARGGNSITAALSRQRQRQGQAAIRSSQPKAGKQSAGMILRVLDSSDGSMLHASDRPSAVPMLDSDCN